LGRLLRCEMMCCLNACELCPVIEVHACEIVPEETGESRICVFNTMNGLLGGGGGGKLGWHAMNVDAFMPLLACLGMPHADAGQVPNFEQ
jgi:hypothetical protein